jgi:hypothetical protein
MAVCKFCSKPFAWGNADGKWVPLVPVGADEGLDRAFQDENGALRAAHRLVCVIPGGPTVRVSNLARPIPAGDVLPVKPQVDPDTGEIAAPPAQEPAATPKKCKRKRGWAVEQGLGLGSKFNREKAQQ